MTNATIFERHPAIGEIYLSTVTALTAAAAFMFVALIKVTMGSCLRTEPNHG
jgi:hypothetical protein